MPEGKESERGEEEGGLTINSYWLLASRTIKHRRSNLGSYSSTDQGGGKLLPVDDAERPLQVLGDPCLLPRCILEIHVGERLPRWRRGR